MPDPIHLLFERSYEGAPLFKNQNDLVQQLLNHPSSTYREPDKNNDEYLRALNRVKIYLSQLLSTNVNRNITEDFKTSLQQLLQERLKGLKFDVSAITQEIIQALKEKNSVSDKAENKNSLIDQVYADLSTANYIAVITSRPLEISKDLDAKPFSLQRFLISDLYLSFQEPSRNLKSYRFNFPMEQYGEIFWKSLKKIVRTYITDNQHEAILYDSLYSNYFIPSEELKPLKRKTPLTNGELEIITDGVLNYLNRKRYVLVFTVKLPVYSMSLVALDPDDPFHAKVYAIFDTTGRHNALYKYAKEDYLLWRLFVWDKLKTDKSIEPHKYISRLFE